ncbi:hypothetical protein DL96DRAFT_1457837 [Flagelloscypha sp. PMI_526]|nr:hypothetical protein DL96DRAFT_1457837 [Flagelloscypha sp. PMI_526]
MSQSPTSPSPPQSSPTAHVEDSSKKRKRSRKDDGEPAEPRRLRRSHEACARCRSKKIKVRERSCDSKHPRCTACATANVQCEQEDRHRQTLTPRGYTEGLELQLKACAALLAHHIPGFQLRDIETHCARAGIDASALTVTIQPQASPPSAFYPSPSPLISASSPLDSPTIPEVKGQDPNGNDVSQVSPACMVKSFGVGPQQQLPHLNQILGVAAPLPPISTSIQSMLSPMSAEDISVGMAGLSSGRDRYASGGPPSRAAPPRQVADWILGSLKRTAPGAKVFESVEIWLPRDRSVTRRIVDVYFERLNIHRPVYDKPGFDQTVDELYSSVQGSSSGAYGPSTSPVYDEGFICSFYLILALGTLSEKNHLNVPADSDYCDKSMRPLPESWPGHDEFFQRALSVKPELRVTLSSLQALILLHWYLYCEIEGRSLWRLVGSLVRLGTELGLHHDPRSQMQYSSSTNGTVATPVHTAAECALRIRLWGIVMIHDRATSSLLGRPLAIGPTDTNCPNPVCIGPFNSMGYGGDGFAEYSPHFAYSQDLADIQADICVSLYSPGASTDDIVRYAATRIMKSLADFRQRTLPARYQEFFRGSQPTSSVKLEPGRFRPENPFDKLTEDEGLTLLKTGFTRILLLRAIFANKDLDPALRKKALTDAISTAHNAIHIHNRLISFPSIAFFTSPIPLHISAMVILTGHSQLVGPLERHTAVEDVWLALDMLPRFRWRWERKDCGGEHPALARMVEQVMQVDLSEVRGCSGEPVLIEEHEWDEHTIASLRTNSPSQMQLTNGNATASPTTASHSPTSTGFASQNGYPQKTSSSGTYGNSIAYNNSSRQFEIPNSIFYPFFPAQSTPTPTGNYPAPGHGPAQQTPPMPQQQDLSALITEPSGPYGCQPSQDAYYSEERDSEAYYANHPQQHPQQQQQYQPQAYHTVPQHQQVMSHPGYHYAPPAPGYSLPSSNHIMAHRNSAPAGHGQPMMWSPTQPTANGHPPQSPRVRGY